MRFAWKRGGMAILQAGLAVCLAAGAWAAERSNYGSGSAAPRTIQPILDDDEFTADQDPAPPIPPELQKKAAADKIVAPSVAAACADGCGACASCDDGCGSCGRSWCNDCCDDGCGPKWTITAGAMYLHRSGARNYVIGDGPFMVDNIDRLEWGTGPRLDVTRHYACWDVQFLFWNVEDWSDEASALTQLLPPIHELAGYSSRLYNTEFNLKRKFDVVTLLAGFRYMELQERLYNEERGLLLTTYQLQKTGNYLYGFQMGAEADIWSQDRVKVSGFGKTGIFGNHVREVGELGIGPIAFTNERTREETALVAEVGVTATVQLTQRLSAYAGYEVMWIDGVVLAPDELRILQARTNTPVYHGANFGLELTW